MLSRLSDSVQCRQVYMFKHTVYISALEHDKALIVGRYVFLESKNTIYKYYSARMIL